MLSSDRTQQELSNEYQHDRVKVVCLTLTMLRLLSSKAQGSKYFLKAFQLSRVGIHWIARADYSRSGCLHHLVLTKLAISNSRD